MEYNFAKLLINKQLAPNLGERRKIIPGVVFAWARQEDRRSFNVVIKGLEWNIPNSIVKAYLDCFGEVSKGGVKWGDI